jgi:hypothetical protein
MGFPAEFFTHLQRRNYTEIKGGETRTSFLEIWVVAVGSRVFARSWNKSKRSWFTAFLETGVGQLKFGEVIINVTGKKVSSNSEIQKEIHEAYRNRYTEKENVFYVNGITKPEYEAYTMEFFAE